MKTLLFCLTLATSRLYAQDTSLFRHLPPEADAIYQFNLPVLTSKLGWQELADHIPLPQSNTSARELAAILKEPYRAGIDPNRSICWTETEGAAADSLRTTSLLLHLADSSRFIAFLREEEPGIRISPAPEAPRTTTTTAATTSHTTPIATGPCTAETAGRAKFGAAWNKDLAVLTFIHSRRSAPPSDRTLARFTNLAIKQSLTQLRGYDGPAAIRDPLFLTSFTDDADIHAWTAPGQLLSVLLQQLLHLDNSPTLDKAPPHASPTGPTGAPIRVLTTLRFEKGRVELKSTLPLPPAAIDPYAKLIARPLNTALLSRIPTGNITSPNPSAPNTSPNPSIPPPSLTLISNTPTPIPRTPIPPTPLPILALFNLHLDPSAIGPLLDSLHERGRVEALLFDKGLSLETFVHAFRGDFLIATVQPDSGHRRPAVYAAVPIIDLPAFSQWMSKLKWLSPPAADASGPGHGNRHTVVGKQISSWQIRDNLLIIGPAHPVTGYAQSDTSFITDRMRESPLSLSIDFRAIESYLSHRDPTPSEKNKNLLAILHHLDRLLLTAGRLDSNGQVENKLELTLSDPSENSLRCLFRLMF